MTIIAVAKDALNRIVMVSDALAGSSRRWPSQSEKLLSIGKYVVGIAGHGYDVSKREIVTHQFSAEAKQSIDCFTRELTKLINDTSSHVPDVAILITDGEHVTSIDAAKRSDGTLILEYGFNDIRHSRGDLGWIEMNLFEQSQRSHAVHDFVDADELLVRIQHLHNLAGYPDLFPRKLVPEAVSDSQLSTLATVHERLTGR